MSSTLPFVSICIPVRNGASQLPATLGNLIERTTYPQERIEILIGDHGSTDETASLLGAWARRCSALKVVAVPYTGPNRSFVRNRILARARGELCIFIDHDVLVPADFVSAHVRVHLEHPRALVAGLTYGKGIFGRDLSAVLDLLDLNEIGRSLPQLERQPEFADFRTGAGLLESPAKLQSCAGLLAPYRMFWTCNLSARRAAVQACGGFDEAYESWGVEDDDLALRLAANGAELLYSREAWAFHVPHASDTWANMLSWRHNLRQLQRKVATRELECYAVYVKEIASGARRMDSWIGLLSSVDATAALAHASGLLPPAQGRRFSHFVADLEHARALQLTDASMSSCPIAASPRVEEGLNIWPHFGFATPFESRELEQTVLLVDLLMLLDRYQLALLMVETARISRHVFVVYGPQSQLPRFLLAVTVFDEVLASIRFASSAVIR